MTLADLLEGPDGALVHDDDGTYSRGEVRRRAAAYAVTLRDAGVERGAAVGVSLPNGVDVIAAVFGTWQVGAVYVPVNPRLTSTEVARVVDAVEPAALVTGDGVSTRGGARRYGEDVALVPFTSGTTGPPKPVPLLHDTVRSLLDGVVATLRGGRSSGAPPPTNLVPVSLSLWAGIYQVLFALRVGAPIVVMSSFDTVRFAELVATHEVRSVVLPPAAMAMLCDDERVTSLAPLRFVRSITAPLSPLQARRFKERFGIVVLNGYGQTELGGEVVGWSAADARAHGDDKLGAVGRPHAGVSVRVDAATGELQVRTPATDGWYGTGDVGRVDGDGFVWIEGRLGDMVNRGGMKVFPGEVEEVLRLAPSVVDAAVVGVPDERLGEVPVAFVVGAGVAIDALEAHCRAHLAPYKVPVRFSVVAALPRNEVGKVLVSELRAASCPPRGPH